MTVRPFEIHIDEEQLTDLRRPLALTRWPGELPRMYFESMADTVTMFTPAPVPTACANLPKETLRASRRWAGARYGNIVQWTDFDTGGHFSAIERAVVGGC